MSSGKNSSVSNFVIDHNDDDIDNNRGIDELNVDDRDIDEFDIDGIDDTNNSNPDIDYYPGMSNRHTFLGESEDFKTKINRFYRRLRYTLSQRNSQKLIIGLSGGIMVVVLFTVMFFSGSGADALLPGGAIHKNQGNEDSNDNWNSNNNDNNNNNNNNENKYDDGLVKMNLDDMRTGKFWISDYQLNFIDYEEPIEKSESDSNNKLSIRDDEDKNQIITPINEIIGGEKAKNDNDNKDIEGIEGLVSGESDSEIVNTDRGYYLHQENTIIYLKQAADPNFNRKIIDLSSLTYRSTRIQSTLVSINKSLTKIIVASDMKPQWRYSSTGKYWLVDVNTLEVEPVYGLENKDNGIDPVELNYAAFSPDGNFIHISYETNILLKNVQTGKIRQITKNEDKKDILDGKPDWIYEEEVLGSDRALYWTKDSSKFAFIKWDDTDVPIYNLELFGYDKYPKIEQLKYPKPGFSNPIVSLYVYQISNSKLIKVKQPEEQDNTVESLGNDFIIYQTVWLNEDELLFKRTDRTSRKIQICVFSVKSGKTNIIRTINTNDYNGWYKNNGDIFVLPNNKGYIDNVVNENHDHLAYFKSSTDSEGELITSGEWDVIGGVIGFDEINNCIYFIGTSGNSLQRQIYKVSLETSILTALTTLDDIHSYSLKVSKGGKYGLMKYEGPQLPMQKIVELNKVSIDENYFDNLPNLNNAESISSILEEYSIPYKEYISMKLHDNVTINIIEVKPFDFDENKQYPLLVSVYGGPGIQKVNCNFNYGFEEIVSSSLDAIVLYIDPRGTGGSGWDYRSWARDNIGYWEPRDIVEATQDYINERDFIDMERVAIWGWSYGGFTTLKTLEFDHGITFKYGMAVAPVTNWYLYDSIYTERYMGSPKDKQYKDAKISEIIKFKDIYRFLIMHGTADDNVHYQNTLQLLNEFDLNGIENYDLHIFPDSDHSITHDNANVIVYDKLFNWISTAFAN